MPTTFTIAKRELSSLFFSPIAYVVLGLFALGASLIFFLSFQSDGPATLRPTFTGVVWLLIFLAPAVSMRLVSEELRSGTFETLMTSPISDAQVIVGKWLGAMVFFLVLLLPLIAPIVLLEVFANPDYGPIFTGLLGLLLVGAFYLSIGAFASTTTQNQVIAFLVTAFVIGFFTFVTFFLARASFIHGGWQRALVYMNVNDQFADFGKGLIDVRNFAFFLSGTALFLFLAVKTLESRRWR